MNPLEENQLMAERRAKREKWREMGFDYPEKFDWNYTSKTAKSAIESTTPRATKAVMEGVNPSAKMAGRIINKREMGKLTFLKIRDMAGDFQLCLAQNVLEERFSTWNELLDLGDIIGAEGEFFRTKHGEPSLMVSAITPLSKALRPLPEKFHGLADKESCYRQRYLDLVANPKTRQRFLLRSRVIKEIRSFLDARGFVEVETRTLQPQAGGAMAKPFFTHHNALDHEFALRIALELDLKMLTIGGLERVYEIGKCFRNEGMDPSHLQEFTMLEWYAAYADLEDNMRWAQKLVLHILDSCFKTRQISIVDNAGSAKIIDFNKKWEKVSFYDVLGQYADFNPKNRKKEEIAEKALSLGFSRDDVEKTSIGNLLDYIYKKTARPHLDGPIFVTHYPSSLKPLARPNENGTASCYQLLIGGWEVINSYGELVNPDMQYDLLAQQAAAKIEGDEEAMPQDADFVLAMQHGMPPQTGFGMGIDRFVALMTGQDNLRDVVLFPLMKDKN